MLLKTLGNGWQAEQSKNSNNECKFAQSSKPEWTGSPFSVGSAFAPAPERTRSKVYRLKFDRPLQN